jgi:hypothetical protein
MFLKNICRSTIYVKPKIEFWPPIVSRCSHMLKASTILSARMSKVSLRIWRRNFKLCILNRKSPKRLICLAYNKIYLPSYGTSLLPYRFLLLHPRTVFPSLTQGTLRVRKTPQSLWDIPLNRIRLINSSDSDRKTNSWPDNRVFLL